MSNESPHDPRGREFNRRASYIIIEYTVREGVFRDIIKNIGAKGLFISTQRHIAENQDITMRFPLFSFDHLMEVKGRVARSGPYGFAVVFDEPIEGLIAKAKDFPHIVHEIDR